MSDSFYNSIIHEEKLIFGVKDETLVSAAKAVGKSYNRESLKKGSTFLDYNNPPNRCAYLFKYAALHTEMVTKYFEALMKKSEVKKQMKAKSSINICCLGGGPGVDIVGIFKILARYPHYHQKVMNVTVLDICGGWRNSFKLIMTHVTEGKVKNIPPTFVNATNFKAKLIEVNLLRPLSTAVAKIISEADIICMVKFVSAILGNPESLTALKVIGETLKLGALVFFIDNYHGNTFEPMEGISSICGLRTIVGPMHESFCHIRSFPTAMKEQYKNCPLFRTKISIIGWMKEVVTPQPTVICAPESSGSDLQTCDSSWETDSSGDEIMLDGIDEDLINNKNVNTICKAEKMEYSLLDKTKSSLLDSSCPTSVAQISDIYHRENVPSKNCKNKIKPPSSRSTHTHKATQTDMSNPQFTSSCSVKADDFNSLLKAMDALLSTVNMLKPSYFDQQCCCCKNNTLQKAASVNKLPNSPFLVLPMQNASHIEIAEFISSLATVPSTNS